MFKIFEILSGMSTGLFAQFLLFFGRKYSTAVASVIAFIAITVAMIFCLKSVIETIVSLMVIPPWIFTALGMLIPTAFIQITSSILAGRICRAAYDMAVIKIDLITKAS